MVLPCTTLSCTSSSTISICFVGGLLIASYIDIPSHEQKLQTLIHQLSQYFSNLFRTGHWIVHYNTLQHIRSRLTSQLGRLEALYTHMGETCGCQTERLVVSFMTRPMCFQKLAQMMVEALPLLIRTLSIFHLSMNVEMTTWLCEADIIRRDLCQ